MVTLSRRNCHVPSYVLSYPDTVYFLTQSWAPPSTSQCITASMTIDAWCHVTPIILQLMHWSTRLCTSTVFGPQPEYAVPSTVHSWNILLDPQRTSWPPLPHVYLSSVCLVQRRGRSWQLSRWTSTTRLPEGVGKGVARPAHRKI